MKWIDLNSDLGESFGNYKLGDTAVSYTHLDVYKRQQVSKPGILV